MTRNYAGIGSRETPHEILTYMTNLAAWLSHNGFNLRSGGARGADTAFANGASLKRIFTPQEAEERPDWHALAKKFHPAWKSCSPYARLLHARNGPIVLGENLDDPVDMTVCWTRDGVATGGTGQALRIAEAYNIPVFNLSKEYAHVELERFLQL